MKTVDSREVSAGVLKMAGITRDRMNYDRPFLSSKSGLGGGDFTFYREKVRPPTCFITVEPHTNLPKGRVSNSRTGSRGFKDFKKLFAN